MLINIEIKSRKLKALTNPIYPFVCKYCFLASCNLYSCCYQSQRMFFVKKRETSSQI